MRTRTALSLILLAAGAAPAGAAAQSCLGLPSRDGQIGVIASFGSTDGPDELGGDFHADVTGPASFQFGARTRDQEVGGQIYSARGAYELYMLQPSICFVGGVFYRDHVELGIDDRLGIPLGIGIGKTAGFDLATVTLYALPQYVRVREVQTILQDVAEQVVTTNEFMGEIGLNLGFRPFYLGTALAVSTMDDPALRFRLGLLF